MAELSAKVNRDLDWTEQDKLRLRIGSENAASLAASTPAGGTVVDEQQAWEGGMRGGFGADPFGQAPFGFSQVGYGFGEGEFGCGAFGINDAPRVQLSHRYRPDDVCAVLPIGVDVVDEYQNASSIVETRVGLNDSPDGIRDLAIAATATPLEARLSWTQSPHV